MDRHFIKDSLIAFNFVFFRRQFQDYFSNLEALKVRIIVNMRMIYLRYFIKEKAFRFIIEASNFILKRLITIVAVITIEVNIVMWELLYLLFEEFEQFMF